MQMNVGACQCIVPPLIVTATHDATARHVLSVDQVVVHQRCWYQRGDEFDAEILVIM